MEEELVNLFDKNCIYVNFNRHNSGKGRSQTLGKVHNIYNCKHGIKPYYTLSKYSEKKPEIYEAVFKYGKIICPFDFTSVTLNKNYKCLRHKDKGNVAKSLIVGLGDYKGGRLCIERDDHIEKIDIKNKPLIFEGSKYYHWVEDFTGTRYTLVFYNI